ncbi:MAG: hypothetical protein ABIJ34_02615 [archaeon]
MTESQFETGRRINYERDYFRQCPSWTDDQHGYFPSIKNFDYSNSTETTETDEELIFRVPLSEISIENLKIVSEPTYIIVQSNKKTIFINLHQRITSEKLTTDIKGNMLVIRAKKLQENIAVKEVS